MSEAIIATKGLSKSFKIRDKEQEVLKNLDIEIYNGDFTVIMGSSGAGKSTLLYALSGMDKPSSGEITYINGDEKYNISGMSNDSLAIFRRKHCGFVFQDINLNDSMSVMDNILVAGYIANKNKKAVREYAAVLLGKVGVASELWDKFPSQLSGGEAQRIGIVRAMINNPDVLFADEPTGALNSNMSKAVLDIMCKINEEGQSVLIVTHDIKSAIRGNRILYIKDGIVSDELSMEKYTEDDDARLVRVQEFLNNLGW